VKVIPIHAMKECGGGGARDEGGWTASSSSSFTLRKGLRYPLNRSPVWAQRVWTIWKR